MILDKTTNTAPTIDEALAIVDTKAESFNDWKSKGLGLRLVLLGLAEVQSLRLSKLAGMVYEIEGQLLDKEKIRNLEPKQLFHLYQLTSKALVESSDFVERTLRTTDWAEMESGLLQVKAKEAASGDSKLDTATAQEMLTMLAKMQAQQDVPEQGE